MRPAKLKIVKKVLGVELGSTRIKAVLINECAEVLASGDFEWENKFADGIWTYSLDDAKKGIQCAVAALISDYERKTNEAFPDIDAVGVSGMMHGYLAFDSHMELLVPFRTWRCTVTQDAARELTEAFDFNVPQRWSVAHLRRAIVNKEEHVSKIDFITTLSGWVHYMLTGERLIGIGDASGMFPIDSSGMCYRRDLCEIFDSMSAKYGFTRKIESILPEIRLAGEPAGKLTESGAAFLDPTGKIKAGIVCAPPEGDAGTGMTATDAVAPLTGNVSAGTSVFAMSVLDRPLSKVYPEIDMVTTPDGAPVAMVHCNTCTSDIDSWVKIFGEFADAAGHPIGKGELYGILYGAAMRGRSDCGGVISYNCYSGEPALELDEGRPMTVRIPGEKFALPEFMRSMIFSSLAPLSIGMELLANEGVKLRSLTGHGGFFKTAGTTQPLMASALKTPVSVMETAGEGGPWGMAVLALFVLVKDGYLSLGDFLDKVIFKNAKIETCEPNDSDTEGFEKFLERYKKTLPAERLAGKLLE